MSIINEVIKFMSGLGYLAIENEDYGVFFNYIDKSGMRHVVNFLELDDKVEVYDNEFLIHTFKVSDGFNYIKDNYLEYFVSGYSPDFDLGNLLEIVIYGSDIDLNGVNNCNHDAHYYRLPPIDNNSRVLSINKLLKDRKSLILVSIHVNTVDDIRLNAALTVRNKSFSKVTEELRKLIKYVIDVPIL